MAEATKDDAVSQMLAMLTAVTPDQSSAPPQTPPSKRGSARGSSGRGAQPRRRPLPERDEPNLAQEMYKEEFDALFDSVAEDFSGTRGVGKQAMTNLLTSTSLDHEKLAEVWELSFPRNSIYMTEEDFSIALRLTSLAQQNRPIELSVLETEKDVIPPVIQGTSPRIVPAQSSVEPAANEVPVQTATQPAPVAAAPVAHTAPTTQTPTVAPVQDLAAQQEVAAMKDKLRAAEERATALEAQLAAANARVEDADARAESANERASKSEQAVEEARAMAEAAQDEAHAAFAAGDQAADEHAEQLKRHRSEATAAREEKEDAIAHAEIKIKEHKDAYSTLQAREDERVEKLFALEADLDDAREEVESLHAELNRVGSELGVKEHEVETLEAQLHGVEVSLAAKENLVADMESELTFRDDAIREKDAHIGQLSEENDALESELGNSQATCALLEASLTEKVASLETTTTALEERTQALEVARRELDACEVRIVDAETKMSHLRRSLDEKTELLETAHRELDNASSKLAATQDELYAKTTAKLNVGKQFDKLSRRYDELKVAKKRADSRVLDLESELAAKSSGDAISRKAAEEAQYQLTAELERTRLDLEKAQDQVGLANARLASLDKMERNYASLQADFDELAREKDSMHRSLLESDVVGRRAARAREDERHNHGTAAEAAAALQRIVDEITLFFRQAGDVIATVTTPASCHCCGHEMKLPKAKKHLYEDIRATRKRLSDMLFSVPPEWRDDRYTPGPRLVDRDRTMSPRSTRRYGSGAASEMMPSPQGRGGKDPSARELSRLRRYVIELRQDVADKDQRLKRADARARQQEQQLAMAERAMAQPRQYSPSPSTYPVSPHQPPFAGGQQYAPTDSVPRHDAHVHDGAVESIQPGAQITVFPVTSVPYDQVQPGGVPAGQAVEY